VTTTPMRTYLVLRRRGWSRAELLEMAAARSVAAAAEMADEVTWLRSYVLAEDDEKIGVVCIYRATGPEAIRAHAGRALLPVDEIIEVADTVVMAPDPVLV
jgi:Protein of unknown function (DUF4242)